MYEVIDLLTKQVVKTYAEGKGKVARRWADKMDLQYGAIRYAVRFVEVVKA